MLDKVRITIAINLARKALAMIESGEFEKILKGIGLFQILAVNRSDDPERTGDAYDWLQTNYRGQ